jgi:glycosyltransferase involved in cell wall biosynthesis
MAADPLLSVVVPAYNVASYIKPAVLSALDQTLRDLEVIVVDDGSTDATREALQEIVEERRDPRLKIVARENGGLAVARNTGIRHAAGRYVGLLDGDDLWLPAKAERHVALLDSNPSIGLTFSHSRYAAEDGSPLRRCLVARNSAPTLRDMIRRNHVGSGSSPILRRECFDRAGLFREDLRACEDYEMWCRILRATSFTMRLVPEPLTLYRIRTSSLTYSFDDFLRNADRAMRGLRELMPELPKRWFMEGHAEHYRIAAWKAATSGDRRAAARYLAHAVGLCPWLPLRDWRALAASCAILSPAPVIARLGR